MIPGSCGVVPGRTTDTAALTTVQSSPAASLLSLASPAAAGSAMTAYRMGYFERPRDANARAVAEALDISPSTFAEHLAAARRKLLEETLAGE